MALQHADMILGLQEDLTSAEMPAEWMWPLPWEMEKALKRVSEDRKAGKIRNSDDDDDGFEPGDGVMIVNDDLPDWVRG